MLQCIFIVPFVIHNNRIEGSAFKEWLNPVHEETQPKNHAGADGVSLY